MGFYNSSYDYRNALIFDPCGRNLEIFVLEIYVEILGACAGTGSSSQTGQLFGFLRSVWNSELLIDPAFWSCILVSPFFQGVLLGSLGHLLGAWGAQPGYFSLVLAKPNLVEVPLLLVDV